jgi:hypothetical protein
MALSPLVNLPVQWEVALVDLQPTSLYGADHDTAMVNTTILLQSPASEEITFVLPAADAPEQDPVMRIVADAPEEPQTLSPSTLGEVEGELGEALAKAEQAQRELWEKVREAASEIRSAKVKVKQGEQLVRFYYPQKVPRQPDGSLEFRILAPLASFVLNPGGGELTLAIGLPRVAGRAVTLQDAHFENPVGTNSGAMEQATLAQRQFASHYLRHDPLYVVKYAYT